MTLVWTLALRDPPALLDTPALSDTLALRAMLDLEPPMLSAAAVAAATFA